MGRILNIHDITDREVRRVVADYPDFVITRGKKHLKIVNPVTGCYVTASSTGSDWRGHKNLRRDLHHLAANGNTWHLPPKAA
ncbi:MAG TPA: hypothetical protein PLM62_04490 [Zoogloea sp.]|nr:hypothetical protein [Zoogloea sp.]